MITGRVQSALFAHILVLLVLLARQIVQHATQASKDTLALIHALVQQATMMTDQVQCAKVILLSIYLLGC